MTPPGVATWLLQHFMPACGGEAFIGDLHERYAEGRSRSWFWRQVLFAMGLAAAEEIRRRKGRLLWMVLASVSVALLSVLPHAQSNVLLRVWAALYITAGLAAVLLALAPTRPVEVRP